MNVGRMSMVSFAVFLVGIVGLFAVVASGSPVVLVPFIIVWLGSFAYAMYLWVAVMRYGDRRLVKRGSQGTAQVLSAKETSWAMSAGDYEGIGAPTVWKYGLQVSVSGKDPYPTTLYICAHLRSGDTVPVYVSPHNAKRVTVDLKQLAAASDAELRSIGTRHHSSRRVVAPDSEPPQAPAATIDVADELAKLADLKDRGVLSDAEFASQKAKLLGAS
jgi:hypothetical protein